MNSGMDDFDKAIELEEIQEISYEHGKESVKPCNCDAKLADIVAALEGMQDRLKALTEAVNTTGSNVQSITDTVQAFAQKFSGMNPMQLIKGAMSGGR